MYYISELAKKLSLNQDTIRYYEKLDLIKPKRGENGYRIYTQGDYEKIRDILLIKDMGYTLAEIKEYYDQLSINSISEEKLVEYFDLKIKILEEEKSAIEEKIERIKIKREKTLNKEYCVEKTV